MFNNVCFLFIFLFCKIGFCQFYNDNNLYYGMNKMDSSYIKKCYYYLDTLAPQKYRQKNNDNFVIMKLSHDTTNNLSFYLINYRDSPDGWNYISDMYEPCFLFFKKNDELFILNKYYNSLIKQEKSIKEKLPKKLKILLKFDVYFFVYFTDFTSFLDKRNFSFIRLVMDHASIIKLKKCRYKYRGKSPRKGKYIKSICIKDKAFYPIFNFNNH